MRKHTKEYIALAFICFVLIAGALFLKEDLNIYTGMAFITIIVSVYLVNSGYRKQNKGEMKLTSKMAGAFPESAVAEL